jgi:hypothetical protein
MVRSSPRAMIASMSSSSALVVLRRRQQGDARSSERRHERFGRVDDFLSAVQDHFLQLVLARGW